MDAASPILPCIACLNHKGGVGKTTCAVNLAAGLTRLGWRILAVDADPQAHLTTSLGLTVADGSGLAGVLGANVGPQDAVEHVGALAVLPGSAALAEAETRLSVPHMPLDRLRQAVAAFPGLDAVIIDCPPHLGPLTRQALAAATGVIVPMTPDFLAMQSLAWLMDTLAGLSGQGHAPTVVGIVLNRFSAQKRLHREVRAAVAGHFPGVPFQSVIRENIALAEAPSFGQDIFRYAPRSAGAADFAALCRETMARLGQTPPTGADPIPR